jgi:hypothetical protein
VVDERAWTISTHARLADITVALGGDLKAVRLGSSRHAVTGTGIDYLWIVEGRRGTAIWVYPLSGRMPELTVRLASGAHVRIQDARPRAELLNSVLPAGEHRMHWAYSDRAVLITTVAVHGTQK